MADAQIPIQCRTMLVIGYGNELRQDDGLGPKLAEAIGRLALPGVQIRTIHQLTPELADPISTADAVVFLDAAVDSPREIQFRPLLQAATTGPVITHGCAPSALLRLAHDVFGQSPAGWWLTIPAFELGFGDQLSTPARGQLDLALPIFLDLWKSWRAEQGF